MEWYMGAGGKVVPGMERSACMRTHACDYNVHTS